MVIPWMSKSAFSVYVYVVIKVRALLSSLGGEQIGQASSITEGAPELDSPTKLLANLYFVN